MMSSYQDEDFLMLSGIQHIAFCERQWALIHIEQVWAENILTVEGKHLHERTDNPFEDETRKDIRVVRAMPLVSHNLGLRGVADVVEFHRVEDELKGTTVRLEKRKGWWRPYPVEYKRGRTKPDDRDVVQLCAQAIALEEMFNVSIDSGYLFYGQTKRRDTIFFNKLMRLRVEELSQKMHKMISEGTTPKAQGGKRCCMCSLMELCQPNLTSGKRSVKDYLVRMINLGVKDL